MKPLLQVLQLGAWFVLIASLTACGSNGDGGRAADGASRTATAGSYQIQKTSAEVARLEAEIDSLVLLSGERGEPGVKGTTGPLGERGAAGDDLSSDDIVVFRSLVTDAVVRNYGVNMEEALRRIDKDIDKLETSFTLLQGALGAVKVIEDAPDKY